MRGETEDRLLTPRELADRLDVPISTLHQWRSRNQGPRSFRIGRHVRYRAGDVATWIESQVRDTGRGAA